MKQFVLFLCVGTLALFSACKFAEDASVIEGVGGRTLYVSAEGNDYNDGLTEDSAWRTLTRVNKEPLGPDDQVLFRRGDVWVCNDERPNRTGLVPQGRGNAGHPVVIGTYGTGANRPVIAGSGVPEAVRIEKMEYVRVEGLKITNDDQFGWLGDTSLKGPQDRCGVDVNVLHVDY
ncbi:MAG: hypothetical protein FWF29_08690, partial [Treponema sp.]|nr:hypothetical protein [Treponema sp.]